MGSFPCLVPAVVSRPGGLWDLSAEGCRKCLGVEPEAPSGCGMPPELARSSGGWCLSPEGCRECLGVEPEAPAGGMLEKMAGGSIMSMPAMPSKTSTLTSSAEAEAPMGCALSCGAAEVEAPLDGCIGGREADAGAG